MAAQFAAGPPGGGSRWRVVFGPDSPVPNLRDLKDFFQMVRWFFGRGSRPSFDRWAYWEKVDFWGAAADSVPGTPTGAGAGGGSGPFSSGLDHSAGTSQR